jgi:heat shock protein HtpX
MPQNMAAMAISSQGGFSRLFMTHPPLEERIEALRAGQ